MNALICIEILLKCAPNYSPLLSLLSIFRIFPTLSTPYEFLFYSFCGKSILSCSRVELVVDNVLILLQFYECSVLEISIALTNIIGACTGICVTASLLIRYDGVHGLVKGFMFELMGHNMS